MKIQTLRYFIRFVCRSKEESFRSLFFFPMVHHQTDRSFSIHISIVFYLFCRADDSNERKKVLMLIQGSRVKYLKLG